jgi:hypothetical protein
LRPPTLRFAISVLYVDDSRSKTRKFEYVFTSLTKFCKRLLLPDERQKDFNLIRARSKMISFSTDSALTSVRPIRKHALPYHTNKFAGVPERNHIHWFDHSHRVSSFSKWKSFRIKKFWPKCIADLSATVPEKELCGVGFLILWLQNTGTWFWIIFTQNKCALLCYSTVFHAALTNSQFLKYYGLWSNLMSLTIYPV